MVRPSNRERILSAALAVVQRDGVGAVTFDAVADQAGLTRGGVIYHFSDRSALLAALHAHLAEVWEEQLEAAAGKPASRCTADERLAAYAQIASRSATKAELQLLLEASADAEHLRPWQRVMHAWSPALHGPVTDHQLDRMIARLAADGLWMNDSLTSPPIPPLLRKRLADRIAQMIGDGDT